MATYASNISNKVTLFSVVVVWVIDSWIFYFSVTMKVMKYCMYLLNAKWNIWISSTSLSSDGIANMDCEGFTKSGSSITRRCRWWQALIYLSKASLYLLRYVDVLMFTSWFTLKELWYFSLNVFFFWVLTFQTICFLGVCKYFSVCLFEGSINYNLFV